ncbi:hypothetical protein M3Y94_00634200 [Aphelenchoides besseyi]|nr:hypothetical protein M3Y94_00634200 [Aphelenchoides besseyi]KAI6230957.1 hypothetical protein M3Y95_00330800 [Aphelenchoides besseyi]
MTGSFQTSRHTSGNTGSASSSWRGRGRSAGLGGRHISAVKFEGPNVGSLIEVEEQPPASQHQGNQPPNESAPAQNLSVQQQPTNVQQNASGVANESATAVNVPFRERMWQNCLNGEYSDVVLSGKGVAYPVSKAIVAVGSKYLKNIFVQNPSLTTYDLPEMDDDVAYAALEFLYRGKLENYSRFGDKLMKAAELLEIDELKMQFNNEICKEKLISCIVDALASGDVSVQNKILDYIHSHPNEVAEVKNSAELKNLNNANGPLGASVLNVLNQ